MPRHLFVALALYFLLLTPGTDSSGCRDLIVLYRKDADLCRMTSILLVFFVCLFFFDFLQPYKCHGLGTCRHSCPGNSPSSCQQSSLLTHIPASDQQDYTILSFSCFICCLAPVGQLSSTVPHNFCSLSLGFPSDTDGKESTCNAGHLSLTPELGRSPGEGNLPLGSLAVFYCITQFLSSFLTIVLIKSLYCHCGLSKIQPSHDYNCEHKIQRPLLDWNILPSENPTSGEQEYFQLEVG